MIGLGRILKCFLGDRASFRTELGFTEDGDFPRGVSCPTTLRRFVGAGVTGDCNLLATGFGGINAGASLRIATFNAGEGRLSRMG